MAPGGQGEVSGAQGVEDSRAGNAILSSASGQRIAARDAATASAAFIRGPTARAPRLRPGHGFGGPPLQRRFPPSASFFFFSFMIPPAMVARLPSERR